MLYSSISSVAKEIAELRGKYSEYDFQFISNALFNNNLEKPEQSIKKSALYFLLPLTDVIFPLSESISTDSISSSIIRIFLLLHIFSKNLFNACVSKWNWLVGEVFKSFNDL